MKALWNNQVIAETPKEDLIRIEGNYYFPPESIDKDNFQPSQHTTHCFWKGESKYYDVVVDGKVNNDAAWYYPTPMAGSVERVKKDFSNYVAFWHGVEITD